MRLTSGTPRAVLCPPAFAVFLFACTSIASAKIDLVTLPERESTQLTIYNSEDLTLVRESRTLAFSAGMNEIQFSWSGTLIDPTSLQISLPANATLTVVDAVFPRNTRDLIIWNIEAEESTTASIEISYFTSGLTWSANYLIMANDAETSFDLQQFTRITNRSGEDFESASTRVVVGEVNLLEAIAELARRGIMTTPKRLMTAVMDSFDGRIAGRAAFPQAVAPMSFEERTQAADIIRRAVSEYHLFAVEGKESIRNGFTKALPNPVIQDIAFDLSYERDPRRFGPEPIKFYKLRNESAVGLGKSPLPEGVFYIYARDGRDGLRFEGNTHHEYIPIGEEIELNLGSDGRLIYENKTISKTRDSLRFDTDGNLIGWREITEMQIDLRNSRDRAVPVKLTEYFSGDWEIEQTSHPSFNRIDRETVRWELTAEPSTVTSITYTVVVRHGQLARQ